MSIASEYIRQLQKNNYQADSEQEKIVQHLQQLQLQLEQQQKKKQTLGYKIKSFLRLPHSYKKIYSRTQPEHQPTGAYIWGDVGRGKTWLMDMFYDTIDTNSLSGQHKIRLHFNHFMQLIHDQLSLIDEQKKPLQHIARAFAQRYQLLCLDEFHVSDITDAMLLYGLLETLFEQGVVLVTTSNQPPDELYRNGLQRERFLPAIELIKTYSETLTLEGKTDHRLRILDKADIWYLHSQTSHQQLEARFMELITSPAQRNHKIHINYRQIETRLYTCNTIWFDFNIICGHPRSSTDYIEIARQFNTVFIHHIEQMDEGKNDKARRFINMIDEFYDRNVNLLCSAESLPEALYSGKQLSFEFKRTISRLQEMRSHDYMQRPHKSR
ncbi:ATPase, AFG1 family [hydrothermal vent metagenome]|uniref:ATPase, AFG1 family n=1 Tax=hydrothermal vent metagenome TaxID=652676 RepID=A0A3B0X2D1_9ZZZZ